MIDEANGGSDGTVEHVKLQREIAASFTEF